MALGSDVKVERGTPARKKRLAAAAKSLGIALAAHFKLFAAHFGCLRLTTAAGWVKVLGVDDLADAQARLANELEHWAGEETDESNVPQKAAYVFSRSTDNEEGASEGLALNQDGCIVFHERSTLDEKRMSYLDAVLDTIAEISSPSP